MRHLSTGLIVLIACLVGGCADEEACQAALDHAGACGFIYLVDPCETAERRCRAECMIELTCDELAALESGASNRKHSLCVSACFDSFACADGTAEIPRVWVCDVEEDCLDGSDELDCDYFECRDGSGVLPQYQQCDGDSDCEDGSDERKCD